MESTRAIDILQFVDIDEIDPIYFKKTYYLIPEETGIKAYALLREALGENGKVGMAKVAFREKEHLCALRIKDNSFVLETMYWPDEIRAAEFEELDRMPLGARPGAQDGPVSLIDTLTDDCTRGVQGRVPRGALDIVEKKVAGEEIEVVEEEGHKVVDLMEALKASVEAAKAGKKKAPAKKPAAKRAAKKPLVAASTKRRCSRPSFGSARGIRCRSPRSTWSSTAGC